jgi:hypothetical protein
MKKVIRLTESDLVRLTNKVIKEQTNTLPTPIKQITKSLGLDDVINMGGVNYSVKKLPTGKFKIFVTTPKYKTPVDASSAFGQGTMWKEYATQQEAQNVINSIVDKKGKSGFGIDPLSPIKKVGKSLGLTGIEEQVSNKKVVRLTESDLVRLVKRVVKEQIETSPVQSKGQSPVKYKVGDNLFLYYMIDVYGQALTAQVKAIRGGFGPGIQGPASQKNSMELDCVLNDTSSGWQTVPTLKKGDSVTVVITNVNTPLLAYWKLFKGGKPVLSDDQGGEIVGGKLKDLRIDDEYHGPVG